MKVSFDFDNTLSEKEVQDFCKELVLEGNEVFIVTARISDSEAIKSNWHWIPRQNQQLYSIADECGVPRENIIFTAYSDKIDYLKEKNFIFHIDDDFEEINLIEESNDQCKGIFTYDPEWKQKCLELLKNKI